MQNLGTDYELARAHIQAVADTFSSPMYMFMAEDRNWYFDGHSLSGRIKIYPTADARSRGCGITQTITVDKEGALHVVQLAKAA